MALFSKSSPGLATSSASIRSSTDKGVAEKYYLSRISLASSVAPTLPPYEEPVSLDSHQSVRYEAEYDRVEGDDVGEVDEREKVVVPVVL